MCLAAIYVIVIVQSAGLNSLSTLNFFKEGHVLEILDACIIDTLPFLSILLDSVHRNVE